MPERQEFRTEHHLQVESGMLVDEIRRYWDLRSNGFSESVLHEFSIGGSEPCRSLVDEMGMVPGEHVLDVGCGPGYFALALGTKGFRVTGIDVSEAMISRGVTNAAEAKVSAVFRVMDAQNLGFDDGSFDHIVTRNVLWNLTDPERAYREMMRVLRPGGRIGILDGNFYLEGRKPMPREEGLCGDDFHQRFNKDGVDMSVIGELAKSLPLSKLERPAWDVGVLSRMQECESISVRPLGPRDGTSAIGAFMIVATKVRG